MAAINVLLQNLSDEQQALVESRLVRFEQTWEEGELPSQLRELPADPSLRRALLLEMVKVDLERQWQGKRRPVLEDYLRDYPELGTADSVPADLIQAEYEVRQQFDRTADLADYARRFPRQAEELRHLVAITPDSRVEAAAPDTRPTWPNRDRDHSTMDSARQENQPVNLPEQFGRYRIVERLGQGGMGAVYLAHDTQLDRRVALKVPSFSCQEDPSALERFHREARAAATLDHPNLCPVHDVGQIDGTPYLTMAYVEGESLAQRLAKKLTFSQRDAAVLVRKVALAMAEAHAHGVIHRDLKPSNVMLNRRGEPIVMDFGLARRVHKEDVRLTQSGSLLGTPAYMPPEQVAGSGNRTGPASDVYSLGVILYELLTGKLPFSGGIGEVLAAILTQEPKRPSALRPDVEAELEAICLKAMAKNPADRYASMAEFATALERYLDAAAGSGGSGGRAAKRPSWRSVLVLAAVLLVGAAFLGGFLLHLKTKEGGTLIVECKEDVEVRVTKDGKEVALIDTRTKKEIPLKVGSYELELVDGKSGMKLKTKRVEIESGGRRIAVVSFEPPPRQEEEAEAPKKPEEVFRSLFNGKDRTGWVIDGKHDAEWVVEDGALAVTGRGLGSMNWLLSDRDYKDFVLRFEFQLARGANGGVALRAVPGETVLRTPFHLEVQLADDTDPRLKGEPTGSLIWNKNGRTLVPPDKRAELKPVGDWNEVQIELRGQSLQVLVNGHLVLTTKLDELAGRAGALPGLGRSAGRIGFQKHTGTVRLRNVRIKEVTSPDAQALIECLTDEDAGVRRTAAESLGKLKGQAVVEALGQALSDKDAWVRRAAAHSLRKLKDKAAVKALVKRVADDVWGKVQPDIVSALPSDDTPYEDVATGKHQGSKYAALETLRELAPPETVTEALRAATKSKNKEIKAWALKNLTDQKEKE